jgi:hypothetical protein
VLVYDLATKSATALSDPDGTPVDAAVGKDGAIYISNFTAKRSNVLVYPPHAAAYDVTCGLHGPDAIAVDNEGDVFLNDQILTAVIEIPHGGRGLDAKQCRRLDLVPREAGYTAGIAIDPKTDDLLVLDDPDECAGGTEGRLVIHRKPYGTGRGRILDLGQNCSGGLRLDATSSTVFIGDEDVSASYSFVLQFSYPGGTPMGGYYNGDAGGFITVPNTLPN